MEGLNSDDDEDWMRATPSEVKVEEESAKKRQRKVVTIDDILEADIKESIRKLKPRKNTKLQQKLRAKSHLYDTSDSEGDAEDYRKPTELFEALEKQVTTVAEEAELEWGLPVLAFAPREPSSLARGGAPLILRALQASKEAERGTSLEELVRSGFLRAWAFCSNRCDESTLRWAYHQMAYSSEEPLERASCKFLCDLVSRVSSDSGAPFRMDWLPVVEDLKQTLTTYGYREHGEAAEEIEKLMESTETRSPAKNLRSLLEFIAAYFARPSVMQPYYQNAEVCRLLCMMVHLTLERGLLPILDKIQDCIVELLRYFTPEDWPVQSPGVALKISTLTEKPHNSVYVLSVLSGLGTRSVDLQRHIALLELSKLSRRRAAISTPRDVSSLFANPKLKDKFVDFKKWYLQVVLADTFLWCNEEFASDRIARLGWVQFLAQCSVIYVGDERPFATKLRNIASFLVTKYGEHELEEIGREGSVERFDEED